MAPPRATVAGANSGGRTARTLLALQEEIKRGTYKPGDRLPPERALSQQLGVSRPTVREVIQALVALNILETRHGSGVYVRSLAFEELLIPLRHALELTQTNLRSLFEVRLALEPLAAQLAARRASQEEALEVQRLADAFGDSRLSLKKLIDLDTRFHQKIADAADNAVLANMILSMDVLYREGFLVTMRLPGMLEGVAQGHMAIAEAIVARRHGKAREAMRKHIERVRSAIERIASKSRTG